MAITTGAGLMTYQTKEVLNKVLNTSNDSLQVDIVDATGVSITASSDAEYVDDADWTDGSSSHTLVGGLYQSSPQTITDGDVGPLQVNSSGNLIVDLSATDNAVLDAMVVDLAAMEVLSIAANVDHAANEALLITIDEDTNAIKGHVDGIETLITSTNSKIDTFDAVLDNILTKNTEVDAVLDTIKVDTEAIETAVELLDNAIDGSEMQVDLVSANVTNAGTFAVQADLGANNDVRIESGQVKSGAIASGAIASGAITSGAIASGAVASGAIASGAIASGAVASGAIVAGAVVAGASSFVANEDDASANLDAGVKMLARRTASPADTSGTDGDYEMLQMDNGKLWVTADLGSTDNAVLDAIAASLALLDNSITSGSELQVDVVGALPAGSAAIGKLAANSGVDIGDVDVTSVVPGYAATSLGKREDDAHSNLDTGVMALAVRNDDVAALASTDNDYAPLQVNAAGSLYTKDETGEAGSILVTGTTAVTTAVSNTKFVAIQFIADTVFASGSGGLIAASEQLYPDDTGEGTDIDANGGAAIDGVTFPQGVTIFGRWDGFTLASGKCIGYIAYT